MRSNYFCGTDYKRKKSFWEKLIEKNTISYVFIGKEICPTTQKKHWQFVFHVKDKISIKKAIEITEGRHVEACKGNLEQNIKYCSKDGDTFEYGIKPQRGKRTDLIKIKDMIDEGKSIKEIAQDHFEKWIVYNKSFEKYAELIEEERSWCPEVIYVHGPAGSGKTKMAIKDNATIVNFDGKFWSNYNGEDTILLDDVDNMTFGEHRQLLLQLLDRYPMKIRMLGKWRNWKPRKIYITSNYSPEKIGWSHDKAIMRRISKIIALK